MSNNLQRTCCWQEEGSAPASCPVGIPRGTDGHPAALARQDVPGMKQHTELVLVDLMTHLQPC